MSQKEQLHLTEALVQDIGQLLKTYLIKMGVEAVPVFTLKPIADPGGALTMEELIIAVNTSIEDWKKYPQGIKTKRRDRYIVMRRQIVCFLSRKLGYTLEEIARCLGMQHANVIHGCRLVEMLLKAKDGEMIRTYQILNLVTKNYYKEKYGKDLPEIGK